MKILCVSDEVDPLVYSVNAKKRYADIDLVISSGDLPAKYYEFIISTLNKPLLYVNGNHKGIHKTDDSGYGMGASAGSCDEYYGECIDGKVLYLKKLDLIVAGLGGSMKYNNGLDQYTETAQRRRMARMAPSLMLNKIYHGRPVDILVTHAAPFGIHDAPDLCHRGFECFNRFIDQYRPKYLLHGHVHVLDQNKRPVTECSETEVINVFKSYILEIDK